jgi:NAD dependent epimerase/dehydratase family enzyme
MKFKKIILAGGNGYLGRVLAAYYQQKAEEIIVLSRKPGDPEETLKRYCGMASQQVIGLMNWKAQIC